MTTRQRRRLLLGTSALVVMAALGPPRGASAAEVTPGGALEVTIGGEVRIIGTGGNLDDALLDDSTTTGFDLFGDSEVSISLKGVSEATSLTYGGEVELEADTDATENADETWVYVRSDGWGELRFGDDDGVSGFSAGVVSGEDGAALSAANVAAGTGGLDGDIVSDLFGAPTYEPLGTADATKITYVTPKLGGLNLGVSYTPNLAGFNDGSGNGADLAAKGVLAGDVVEGIAHFKGEVAGLAVLASLSGLYGDVKDEDAAGGDDYWAAQAGAVVELFGLSLGGSYLTEEAGSLEVDAVTLGVGAGAGPVTVSLNYGQVIDSDDLAVNGNELEEPYTLVLSADLGIAPGLALQADMAYFDNDVDGEVVGADDDDGWFGVAAIALEF